MVKDYITRFIDDAVSAKLDPGKVYQDSELEKIIRKTIEENGDKLFLTSDEKAGLAKEVFNRKRKFGILQPLIDDTSVSEIMVNGTDRIFIEKNGQLIRLPIKFENTETLLNVIRKMASLSNRTVNEASPVVDSRLPDGSRVNAVLFPTSLGGPALSIRKFRDTPLSVRELIDSETLSEDEASFLRSAVKASLNILISGGTSSGKTTFLNVLSGFIPQTSRVITVEDAAELRIPLLNLVRLETRPSNSEGKGAITMRDLIKTALRMRPDRIIVGEVRDSSALDMLQALCTGHDGSMSTVHANSAEDALLRLETMALQEGHINSEAIRRQIASGIDIVIHLERDRDMKRRVCEITEVCGIANNVFILRQLFSDGKPREKYAVKNNKRIERDAEDLRPP